MMEKLADYHIHTSFCNHANGTMKEYVKFAISAGLNEIGFSDHNPLPAEYNNHYRMLPEDLPLYLTIIDDLIIQFPQIIIKTGIELDYIESAVPYLKKLVSNNKFDYVIGSVHYLNVDSSNQVVYLNDLQCDNKTKLFCKYFESVEKAILTGLFDIIAHFDLPRRFWGEMDVESMSYAERTLETIKDYDVCLEINTSGFRTKSVSEPFPSIELLRLVKAMEIPITLGSDSHSPNAVGSYFQEAVEILKELGFKEISIFSSRKRKSMSYY